MSWLADRGAPQPASVSMPRSSTLRRFWTNEEGSISIEVLIVMPLLAFVLISSVAYWEGFRSVGQTAKVGHVVSDIVSRYTSVNDADMDDFANAVDALLPNTVDQRTFRVSSICAANGRLVVMWSDSQSGSDAVRPPPLDIENVDASLLPRILDGQSLILTEIKARWRPIATNIGLAEQTWESTLFIKPRFAPVVPHTRLNASEVCVGTGTGGTGVDTPGTGGQEPGDGSGIDLEDNSSSDPDPDTSNTSGS